MVTSRGFLFVILVMTGGQGELDQLVRDVDREAGTPELAPGDRFLATASDDRADGPG
jgi:hypothetical protein